MTTFNTGNPLGSTDVYDRYDNSENLDNFSNGPLDSYPDRLGVMRQSLQGIRNASQYIDLGPYGPGLNFTAKNETFSYLGEFYAPGPSIVLPYTTTGVGAAETSNFRSVGDAVLRSDLAAQGGSALIGHANPSGFGRTVASKLGDTVSFIDYGAIGDGLSHPLSERYASLASAQAKYPFALALTDELDRCAIQLAVNSAADNAELVGGNYSYVMDEPVTVTDKGPLRVIGGVYLWDGLTTNVFKLIGECQKPEFLFCVFKGTGTPTLTQGAIGCASGAITHEWKVTRCRFDGVPFGIYVNADLSGTHNSPQVTHCQFSNLPRFVDDSSGSGLGLVFAMGGTGNIVNGQSAFNVFNVCGRHSLYISDGGRVTSLCDTFKSHRDDGNPIITELAALQIARNAKDVSVIKPVFIGCADTGLTVTSVLTSGLMTSPKNISIIAPSFVNNKNRLMRIGNDSPGTNGTIEGMTVSNVSILSDGSVGGNAIALLSGIDVKIDGVIVKETSGASTIAQLVRIHGFGGVTYSTSQAVANVSGVLLGGSASGVFVDTQTCTGTQAVKIDNISAGATPINYQAAVTNVAIRQDSPPGVIVDFPRVTADPNGVYAAVPGTLFLSKAGTARSLWIKETLTGTSGWVPAKTRLTLKASTASRPALTASGYDIGHMHMDTTLDADGKPIWWNGTAWVDGVGAVV